MFNLSRFDCKTSTKGYNDTGKNVILSMKKTLKAKIYNQYILTQNMSPS